MKKQKRKPSRTYRILEVSARRMHGYTGMSKALARKAGWPWPKSNPDGLIRRRLPKRERAETARHEEREDYHYSHGDSLAKSHKKAMHEQSRTTSGRKIIIRTPGRSGGRVISGRR